MQEAERAKQEEAVAAQQKRKTAAALMQLVNSLKNETGRACGAFGSLAPCSSGLRAYIVKHEGVWLLQVAATNAELLDRKKLEAVQQAAEEKRIAAYIADKAAREQVPVTCLGYSIE